MEIQQITAEPNRFCSGLFGRDEGDIQAAYSCDVFPKIRPPFSYRGKQYTVAGVAWSPAGAYACYADAYPLIPAKEYSGPEEQQNRHEGKSITFRGKPYRLGPMIRFVSRPLTVPEKIDEMRRMFAHGGYFAAKKTYHQLLREWRERYADAVNQEAITQELAGQDFRTQQAMLDHLQGKAAAAISEEQLTLF